jgi:hypothetical protein
MTDADRKDKFKKLIRSLFEKSSAKTSKTHIKRAMITGS